MRRTIKNLVRSLRRDASRLSPHFLQSFSRLKPKSDLLMSRFGVDCHPILVSCHLTGNPVAPSHVPERTAVSFSSSSASSPVGISLLTSRNGLASHYRLNLFYQQWEFLVSCLGNLISYSSHSVSLCVITHKIFSLSNLGTQVHSVVNWLPGQRVSFQCNG